MHKQDESAVTILDFKSAPSVRYGKQLTRHYDLFYVSGSENHSHIADKAEEDKESEELDLTGLDETELDKVI